jgi:hypothetical protein
MSTLLVKSPIDALPASVNENPAPTEVPLPGIQGLSTEEVGRLHKLFTRGSLTVRTRPLHEGTEGSPVEIPTLQALAVQIQTLRGLNPKADTIEIMLHDLRRQIREAATN